jgi:hypothetical protein
MPFPKLERTKEQSSRLDGFQFSRDAEAKMQATIPNENIADKVLKQATREKALGSAIGRGPWLNPARRSTLLHRELCWRDGGVSLGKSL